ncbi:MAG: YbhB/YbcL family Raf kinase inhibitor-like protein [Candidatus Bathyarchaeota archaeon]|nr:YbhB/YbcL family Raf kinase inhibitor-like protein [Candidatus Termiticorpusculum sp.]
MDKLVIKSPAFEANQKIPKKYTCEGDGINPPLTIEGIPNQTKSLALIFDDPDAVNGVFNHWIMWNIPASTAKIEENSASGIEGVNSGHRKGYYPPCPPSGSHRYIFKIYALNQTINLPESTKKPALQKAIHDHILAEGELVGIYR